MSWFAAVVVALTGAYFMGLAVLAWRARGFGGYEPHEAMRIVVPSAVLLALGAQTIFSSFFLSLLGMSRK